MPNGHSSRQKSPSNKIINYDKQEVALGKKNVKGTCPKDKLEFNFFFNPCIYTSFFFFQKKNKILPRWHQFCETEGFLGRYYKSWAVNKNANFEIFSARVSVKNSWLYCLKSPQNILWDNAHKSITTYMYLHVKFYEGLGINKDLLQREALLTDTLVSRDL